MWDDDPEPTSLEREIMAWLRLEEPWMVSLAASLGLGLLLFFVLPY